MNQGVDRVILGLVLAAVAIAVTAGQAHAAMSLSLSRDVAFPKRAYVVTLPEKTRLGVGDVRVTENGGPVRNLRVAPVGAGRAARLGVVMVIDASGSMAGEPFRGAVDAVRAFGDERNPRQPLAALTFATDSHLVLPFTDDQSRIDAALADAGTPSGGTRMYDGLLRAIQLVEDSDLPGGFIVVLSDGTDHGSATTADAVLAAADKANVRIFGVGLRSDRYDPQALIRLAEGSGGAYSEAGSSRELSEIYGTLGAELSNAHVISWRSTAGPGQKVRVRVDVENLGSATTTYTTPRLAGAPAPAADDGSSSDMTPFYAALVFTALLGTALLVLLRGPRQTPRDRVAKFVRVTEDELDDQPVGSRLARGAERSLREASWWDGFATDVDVAPIKRSPGQIIVSSFGASLAVAFVATTLTGTIFAGLIVLLATPFVVRAVIRMRATRERKLFGDQLGDHLSVVGGSLRVGHSLPAALSAALDEAPEPAKREFTRVVADEQLGMPLEDALTNLSKRMDNHEVEHVAMLARLQREIGSDAAEMIDQVVAAVRERQELRRTVQTLTAQGRFAQLILSAMPVVALAVLTVTNRPYVEPLYSTSNGHIALGLAAALLVAGSLVIKKIVTIKA